MEIYSIYDDGEHNPTCLLKKTTMTPPPMCTVGIILLLKHLSNFGINYHKVVTVKNKEHQPLNIMVTKFRYQYDRWKRLL